VQVAPVLKPVIVVENGVPGFAVPEAGEGLPLEQVTETGTLVVGPVGEYTLLTVSVAWALLVIVQDGEPPLTIATLAQLSDSA
jgi:hypothetical protein